MCFAPQRRSLFRHLNCQKWSEPLVSWTFWLRNVLRATMACNFSSLIWPHGSAPAALASLLFDPPEPQIIGKTLWIATFLPFRASASSFFWLFLFSDLLSSETLPISTFHLSILSEVWLLNFLRSITDQRRSSSCLHRFVVVPPRCIFNLLRVIVDLSLLRQEKVEQKCQCMATVYPDDIWWPWCVPWAGCVFICLHISYVHWPRINSTHHLGPGNWAKDTASSANAPTDPRAQQAVNPKVD